MIPEHISLTVPLDGICRNRVSAIKAIRVITSLGLKEAKDISDDYGSEHTLKVNSTSEAEFNEACRILRTEGYIVGGAVHFLLEKLRELAKEALQQQEDDLANEIMQLILAEKLRRK